MKDTRESGYQEQDFVAGFEKLWVWKKAHKLMGKIHQLGRSLPTEERFKLKDQIERSSASVCNNIAEGYTAYYYQDKIKSFYTSRKEAGEAQNQIRLLSTKGYVGLKISQELVKEYEEVIRGINGFINYIRRKRSDHK